ncbi:hypothetical protein ACN2XU_23025 [Primorskyibacter sp. 2E107]|uniref:hypothetical protein n=1 Tax=Primorskyibacter sp. 2E107 TaxID=3403458 RepID=UPI003AF9517B
MKLTQIEIDFDIHKMIEMERRSFDEPPYVALRRLLKLPEAAPENDNAAQELGEGRPFVEDGVTIPHGSRAKMEYLRGAQLYEGFFLDGKLVVNGQAFTALSSAASELAVTKDGSKTSLNGWKYWQVQFPGESKWHLMFDLRKKLHRGR